MGGRSCERGLKNGQRRERMNEREKEAIEILMKEKNERREFKKK